MIVDDKIMTYVLYKMRTVAETRRKCHMLKYEDDYIDEVIDYLVEAGYLNDDNYTKKYIENVLRLKNDSANGIKIDLMQKGVSEDIIEKYLYSDEVKEFEENSCMILAEKKYKSTLDILKVKKFLINKGFTYDAVAKAIDNLDVVDDNNYE